MTLVSARKINLLAAKDESLWEYFKNGNEEAFAMIYQRMFDILYQKGCQMTNNKELVKDCIHDLFLEIWITRFNLSNPASVRAYLTASMQRKVIRKLKRIRFLNLKLISLQEETVPSKEEQLIIEQSNKDRDNKVQFAINSLTDRQKEAIQHKFYSKRSYEEIAAHMNISIGAIYNLVSKAILNLHKDLRSSQKAPFSNN